jgi:glycosyltransferase involved in cell wall biosynthesis
MKILLFLRRIGPYHHARFSTAAAQCNIVVVQTRPSSQEYAWDFVPTGAYVIESFAAGNDPENGQRGKMLTRSVREVIHKHGPDVIVNTGWADPEYNEVVVQATRLDIPLVVISDSRYEDEPRVFYKEWIKKLLLRSYGSALVAGTASRKYLHRLGMHPSAIFQPWDVVDNDFYSPVAPSSPFENRAFICVARLVEKKNHARLLKAFSIYRANGGFRDLVLLGNGDLTDALKKQVDALQLSSHVEFAGFSQQDSVREYLRRSIALILPSVSDQWGLVVNEAMASGVPVLVSSQCGCAQDLVKDGVNGIIFDPFRESGMAEAMMKMDRLDKLEWERMGNSGRGSIASWSLHAFGDGLLQACICASKAPRKMPLIALHNAVTR